MRTRIIFTRHGQTVDNTRDIATGTNESPLTDVGRQQAWERAPTIALYSPAALYASDLGRAIETAKIIGSHMGLEPVIDRRLRERFVGTELQKGTNASATELLAAEFAIVLSMPLEEQLRYRYSHAPEAQTPREKVDELIDFMKDISTRHPGETVVAVSHGAALGNLLVAQGALPFGGVFGADGVRNTAMFVIDFDSETHQITVIVGPNT